MYVKKVKRICGVRGCRNTHNVYAISKTREMGNSVIMCRDCMKDAFESAENHVEPEKVKAVSKSPFYHPELAAVVPSAAETEPEPKEVIESVTEESHIPATEDTVTNAEEDKPNKLKAAKTKKRSKK